MYLLDPDRGARRRALARDKAIHLGRVTGERLGAHSRDLRNRAQGLAARVKRETSGEASRENADDVPTLEGSRSLRSRAADRGEGRLEPDNA